MNHLHPTNPLTVRLSEISDALNDIATRAKALLGQTASKPTGYVGSSRRLTDEERARIVSMARAGHRVQDIASDLAVSRPCVYAVLHAEHVTLPSRQSVHA